MPLPVSYTKPYPAGFVDAPSPSGPGTTDIDAAVANGWTQAALDLVDAVNNDLVPHPGTGATVGYVATVQSDGTYAPAVIPGSGSTGVDLAAGYLSLPGVNGSYVQCPDAAGLHVSGDIEGRWYGQLGSLTGTGFQTLAAKQSSTVSAHMLQENAAGNLRVTLYDSTDGTTAYTATANAPTPAATAYMWQWRQSDGRVQFFYLDPAGSFTAGDGSRWTKIGADRTATGSAGKSIYTGGGIPITLGALGNGTSVVSAGTVITKYQLRAGLDPGDGSTVGVLKASPVFSGHDLNDLSTTDGQGNVWTSVGTAAIIPKSASATSGSTTVTLATPATVQKAAGSWGSCRPNPITGWFHVDNFGPANVDPATWTVAQTGTASRLANLFAKAVTDLANGRGATVFFERQLYVVDHDPTRVDPYTGLNYCAIPGNDYGTYVGSGSHSTTVQLAGGENCHVFGHNGRLQADGSEDQIFNVAWRGLTIDGNRALQDGCHTHDGLHLPQHPGLYLFDVVIQNCDGKGYYSTANGEFSAVTPALSAVTASSVTWTTNTAPTSIPLVSAAGFPTTGTTIDVIDGGGTLRSCKYTGISSNTLTGVTLLGGVATAGTVAAGSPVYVDAGVHAVREPKILFSHSVGNAAEAWYCSATNRATTYTGVYATANGTSQARLVGKYPAATLTASGNLIVQIDSASNTTVSLASGDTPAAVVTKINAAIAAVAITGTAVTLTAADAVPNFAPAVFSTVNFASAHGLGIGTPIVFSGLSGGAGLVNGTTYYVRQVFSATKLSLTLTSGGAGTAVTFTTNGTATAAYGAPVASLSTGTGRLLITSGTWGGISKVYLQTGSTAAILTSLGYTLSPSQANSDFNNYRVGANEYAAVYLDHSEATVNGIIADSNLGDAFRIHNVNGCHYDNLHATRNNGVGIYADALVNCTGKGWTSMMNCADLGAASWRTLADSAETYFDNGTEGYGITQGTTVTGLNGPGGKVNIGTGLDNRHANWSVYVADNIELCVNGDAWSNTSLTLTGIKPGDGGLVGVLRTPAAYKPTAVLPLTPTTKTANYTAVRGEMVLADTSGGTFTIIIPPASAGVGQVGVKWVKGAVAPNIALSGSDHFNTSTGGTTTSPVLLNQGYLYVSDATSVWVIAADDLPFTALQTQFDTRYVQLASPINSAPWAATTAYTTGQYALLPTGGYGYRTAAGISRATFDATERDLWTFIPGGHYEKLTATGNWKCPVGITHAKFELGGAGGGGGGGTSSATINAQVGGSGAGSGQRLTFDETVLAPGTNYAYTHGAGGPGGTGGAVGGHVGTNGTDGGDGVFAGPTSTKTAKGGGKGYTTAATDTSGAVGGGILGWPSGQNAATSITNGCGGASGVGSVWSGNCAGGSGGGTGSATKGGAGGLAATSLGMVVGNTAAGTAAGVNGENGTTATVECCGGGGGGAGHKADGTGGAGGTGADGFLKAWF